MLFHKYACLDASIKNLEYIFRCETPSKKELEDSQDTSEKGPDIIPFANETEGKLTFNNTLI